jgi:hypothetical protein
MFIASDYWFPNEQPKLCSAAVFNGEFVVKFTSFIMHKSSGFAYEASISMVVSSNYTSTLQGWDFPWEQQESGKLRVDLRLLKQIEVRLFEQRSADSGSGLIEALRFQTLQEAREYVDMAIQLSRQTDTSDGCDNKYAYLTHHRITLVKLLSPQKEMVLEDLYLER